MSAAKVKFIYIRLKNYQTVFVYEKEISINKKLLILFELNNILKHFHQVNK